MSGSSSSPVLKRVSENPSIEPTNVEDAGRLAQTLRPRESSKASTLYNRNPYNQRTSEKTKQLLADISRVASRHYNVLITGETGTGKTLAARQIHQQSTRANKPFVELNCANLPEHLVEAELFGYRKGAFTGADRDHKGLFEEADGGILFLDEIGDVPSAVQNKLLKAIDEKKIKRLGTNRYIECDVQIISATSRNLLKMMRRGEFREDLYCRLAVLTIEVPPLRERHEDIPVLIAHYLCEAARTIVGQTTQDTSFKIEHGAAELLCEYDYPGNIRALKNLIYELTSFVSLNEPITVKLVQTTLAKLRRNEDYKMTIDLNAPEEKTKQNPTVQSFNEMNALSINYEAYGNTLNYISKDKHRVVQSVMADEGDLILPVEITVIRKGETFTEWAARAKQASIEAARKATDGTLAGAAKKLGISRNSLKGYFERAKAIQRRELNKEQCDLE